MGPSIAILVAIHCRSHLDSDPWDICLMGSPTEPFASDLPIVSCSLSSTMGQHHQDISPPPPYRCRLLQSKYPILYQNLPPPSHPLTDCIDYRPPGFKTEREPILVIKFHHSDFYIPPFEVVDDFLVDTFTPSVF
ncbi:hypothetical protein L2E82_35646 [Cichorium intybus]|uniref:Uncharacterized protein n=1 Tax=Cichorium intybus TaxID=13427 RepID=A0ACB9BPI2_CICIN|nr:hypothetical protein L2E82_35646 [Cichorium intybus]